MTNPSLDIIKKNYMKQEVLDKLEEARNLVTEAKYIIEDLASKYNILMLLRIRSNISYTE